MTIQSTTGLNKQRLIGFDLFRGIAAYAVAVIHAYAVMIYSGFPADSWMAILTQLSRFAVPFFLAASFYLMTSKLYTSKSYFSVGSLFKSRFTRLLVPYLCWTAIYLSFRIIKSLSTPDGLTKLFQDSVRLIFLGGASIHLYFLPLLFSGSFLILVAEYLVKKHINIKVLVFLLVLSIMGYELLILSGNGFELGTHCVENPSSCSVAFQGLLKSVLPNGNRNQVLRLVLIEIAWLLQCLPYVFLGMLLNYPSVKKNVLRLDKKHIRILLIVLFFISILGLLNAFKLLYFPQSLYELGIAFSLLLLGISMSNDLGENRLIKNLGYCSFGIYFMHYLILIFCAILMAKLPTKITGLSPAITMLTLATLSFVISWIITSLLIGRKPISKLLFGT
jgi:peptidoglycan/LPS O-acetylase OafA/YrhL